MKEKVVMFVVFAIVCVAALVAVTFGVTTHEEAGFMEETPGWTASDFPLPLCVRSYGSENVDDTNLADYTVTVLNMESRINQRLGFQAYNLVRTGCRVTVTIGVPSESGWQDPGGTATIRRGSCDVDISNVTGEVRSLVLYHELGHCLGLDHDDFESSIMRRTQSPTLPGAFPPGFTDHDRQLIRDAYMRH